eukprot:6548649-Pyramimonas_sp.AAC.1
MRVASRRAVRFELRFVQQGLRRVASRFVSATSSCRRGMWFAAWGTVSLIVTTSRGHECAEGASWCGARVGRYGRAPCSCVSGCAHLAQLVGRELLEAGHDAAAGGDGDELELHPAHPAHRWEVLVHQQMVRLVVKAPLEPQTTSETPT